MGQINQFPINTTELASVNNASAADSVLVVDNSVVKQMDPGDVAKAGLSVLGRLDATQLYSGDLGVGSLTLSEAKNNFEFVLYVFRTNVEHTSVILPSSYSKPCVSVAVGPWESSTNAMKYNAYYEITFGSQTAATTGDAYNNANFRLRLVEVCGINRLV